jgi:hypothetical protein
MKLFNYSLILSIPVIIILVLSSACSTEGSALPASNQASHPSSYIWVEDQGLIGTDNIERLQNTIPFTLIFPKYLPEDIKMYPVWLLKEIDANHPESIKVTLEYNNRSSDIPKVLRIIESNGVKYGITKEILMGYLNIGGINIAEQKTRNSFLPSDPPNRQIEYSYIWENNNIYFHADFTGFDQLEARKVIESMFE